MTATMPRRSTGAPLGVSGAAPGVSWRRRWLRVALVGATTGMAAVVAADGSAGWRAARAGLVLLVGAGAMTVARRSRGRARAGAALTVGMPAIIVGGAIGVPHAMAQPSVVAAAGIVALMSGLALVAAAVATLWRGHRRLARAAIVAAALLLIQFLLWPMSMAVFATNRAPRPLPDRTPADVGLDHLDVTLVAHDGTRLAAWYVPSTNGAAIVLLHGSGSTRADVLAHARVLAAHGYGVLMVDARGHGASDGHAMDFGWYGDADIAPAVDHLSRAADVRDGRIAVVGLSMGGEEAIGAAAATPRISAVVAEGVTGRIGEDWLALRPAGVGRWPSTVFYAVQDATAGVLTGADRPIDLRRAVVAAAPRPLLLITAGDVPREAIAARRLDDAAPRTVQRWNVPGAGHMQALSTAPREWEQRVVAFLAQALETND